MTWETLIWGIPFMIVTCAGLGLGLMPTASSRGKVEPSEDDRRWRRRVPEPVLTNAASLDRAAFLIAWTGNAAHDETVRWRVI
jgi:hypothetical protein